MCLGPFNILTVEGCSETTFFREGSIQVFESLYFREYIRCDDFPFFEKFLNLMYIP